MATDIRQRFEEVSTELLQEAYTFTGPSEAVETIWLYLSSQGGGLFAEPVYRIGGTICRASRVDDHLPHPVGAKENHGALTETFATAALELSFDFDDSDQVEPTRTICRYDVATEELNATFRYDPIEHDEDNDTWADVFDRWVARLAETGDDSP